MCTIYHGVTRLGCPVVSQVKAMVQSPGFPPSIVWDNWSVAAAAAAVRPHCSTMDVDAAYCYQLSSVVCLSVTLVSPAKTAELIIKMVEDSGHPKETQVRSYLPGGATAPTWKGSLAPPGKYN